MRGGYSDWDLIEQRVDSTNLEYKVTTGTGALYEKEEPEDDGDPLDYFLDWFEDANNFKSRIQYALENYGYLTEADIAHFAGLESNLSNPFIYYYGDTDKYRKDMNDTLERELDFLEDEIEEGKTSKDSLHFKRVKALREALNKLIEVYGND